jgi:alkylmercury lyase
MATGLTKQAWDELVSTVVEVFPRLTSDEQRISLALYRLLAEGRPVVREALAARVELPPAQVDAVLRGWYGVYYDAAEAVIGYWGLTLSPGKHRFRVNGQTLYTWCAWDTLFIPQILGDVAEVESLCPASDDMIRLTVGPRGIAAADPANTMVSFVTPDRAQIKENVVLNFCHYVYFFRSAESAETWLAEHPDMRLLTLHEAWALGREKNAVQYGGVLAFGRHDQAPGGNFAAVSEGKG